MKSTLFPLFYDSTIIDRDQFPLREIFVIGHFDDSLYVWSEKSSVIAHILWKGVISPSFRVGAARRNFFKEYGQLDI